MFCQKCGKPVPEGEGKIIANHLLCADCAESLVKHYCQRCGKEPPRGTQPQENGKPLCAAHAALPDDSGADEPFRESQKPQPAGLPMLPVWMASLILVIIAGAVGMLFATKTLCFHKWEPATCTQPEICLRCGRIHGEPLPHRWKDADCENPRTCMLCGETEGEPLGHDWIDATCTEPKTCAVCGATEGEALGHQWLPATVAAPRTCRICGETEGKPLALKTLLPVELMSVTKGDFIEASGDARHETIGCAECASRTSTLVSDLFPGCVLAFGESADSTPDHIHVFSGKVTAETSVGMNYKKLSDALGTPSWSISESDLSATATYTIDGVKVGFVFTDKRILNDIIISQIARREKVLIHYPDSKVASARIG